MIQIMIVNPAIKVADSPNGDGSKMLIFQDESGISVSVPLGTEAVKFLGDNLRGSQILVAQGPLPRNGAVRG